MLAERYLNGEYLAQVPDWHAADAPWKAQKVLELLHRNGIAPRTVCDVGCGSGEILVQLQGRLPKGARLTGYDISGQALSLCRPKENAHLSFRQADLTREPPQVSFELLLCLDVFEHVPDYLGFLHALRQRADLFAFHIPLDLSVHTVARASRHLLQMRERYGHLHYFTAETALATLGQTGFEVVDSLYTWDHAGGLFPPRAPGLRGVVRYPLRFGAHLAERLAFRVAPDLTARFRPAYNLLVLARPAEDGPDERARAREAA